MKQELVKVTLQNEMDLILAHKRSMRLAELSGLTLSAQTTFATAVSEVARNTIEHGKNGCLTLYIEGAPREQFLIACITDEESQPGKYEGLQYARRLVSKYNISNNDDKTSIELYFGLPGTEKIDLARVDDWRQLFRNEKAISPYDELKRKNEQLQDLAQKLKESEQQYKLLTNSLPLIIFSLDEGGALTYANEWLRHFTGRTKAQLNATRWKDVVHPEDYDSFSLLITPNVPSSASSIRMQLRLRHQPGDEYYWHMASLSPLKDEEGKLVNWIGFLVDIQAQKLMEATLRNNEELQQAKSQLQAQQVALESNISELNRSNRELQEFAYVASHDLQEPARKISFYSDYLVQHYEAGFDDKSSGYLRNMQTAARRMRSLINDLLSFAQVERSSASFTTIEPGTMLAQVLQDLDLLIADKGARVTIEPVPVFEGDEVRMRQLFENLLRNSIKFAREAIVPEIRIWGEQAGNEVTIYIRDNGIGFDEKYLPQMFALFQRLHPAHKYEGTGLGLAICQKIVTLHEGSITAQSRPGEGATFIIKLPAQRNGNG
ncbi:ATP-binding protein [Flaviaesturariibacter terrae]